MFYPFSGEANSNSRIILSKTICTCEAISKSNGLLTDKPIRGMSPSLFVSQFWMTYPILSTQALLTLPRSLIIISMNFGHDIIAQ